VKRNWFRELFRPGEWMHFLMLNFRLRQTPALLKTLLRASSIKDSKLNIQLLASVDAVLVSSYYCHSEEQVQLGLDLLHFLGELIPMMAKSEFVQFLSFLQAGMMLWIVDEDSLLSDDEHSDLVSLSLTDSLQHIELIFCSRSLLSIVHLWTNWLFWSLP
jgi:hypothetical protein